MAKKVISIECGIWWTKVALVDVYKRNPQVYEAFYFRTPEQTIEDGYIRDKEEFSQVLRRELGRRAITEKNVIFSINSTKVITREVVIPYVPDKQISSVIQVQAKDYFPMDISNYTISFRKMDEVTEAAQDGEPEGEVVEGIEDKKKRKKPRKARKGKGDKKLKLMLIAVPDNLLSNYYNFAESMGFTIESFEYIGNSAVSFNTAHSSENCVLVQMEEQTTIISIIVGRKMVFQRIAPYGYGTTIAAVLDHPVLDAMDEYDAFRFLLDHDVLYKRPKASEFRNSGISDEERLQEALEDAYADLKEALGYHIRVVSTALDYYQNQIQGEFYGKLRLIGDGARFAGIAKLFDDAIPIPMEDMDNFAAVHYARGKEGADADIAPVGILSVIGASIDPLAIKPKEMREKESKKGVLRSAYLMLTMAALISFTLIFTSMFREFAAAAEQTELQMQIQKLAYIQLIVEENRTARTLREQYQQFDDMTKTRNEMLAELIAELENKLPSSMTVQNFSIIEDHITLNLTCGDKPTVEQLLLNLAEIPFLDNVGIPAMAERSDESGDSVWEFSVTATYVDPPVEDEAAADNSAQ